MELHKLKELYIAAAQAYHETGEVIMTDKEFDELEEQIRAIAPSDPILTMTGKGYHLKGIDEKEKFNHPLPMGSIEKEKNRANVLKWCSPSTTWSTKIDGNSIAVYYREGKLWKAITRGKDDIGIDRTAKFVTCNSIPKTIPTKGYVRVRGEAAILKSAYTEANGFDLSKSSRNAVAGAISRQTDWEDVFKFVDFIAYEYRDCDNGEDLSDNDWSMFITEDQKDITEFLTLPIEEFKKKYKDGYRYDADGTVFKKGDELLAFKFEDESAETVLRGVEWSIGKDQRLVPVALLAPVQLAGATIERASMGSYARACSIDAWPVSFEHTVKIIRANEIIPYVVNTVSKSLSTMHMSVSCPVCNQKAQQLGEHMFCVNPTCPNIDESRLLNFSSFFYPEGLADTVILKAFSAMNIKSVFDLVKYTGNFTQEVYGIGESHRILVNQFLSKVRDNVDIRFVYQTFLNGCGRRASEKIVESGFDVNVYDVKCLYTLSNFNSNIISDIVKLKDTIQEFVSLIKITQTKKQKAIGTFCITGVRFKPDQTKIINDLGWQEDSSVKKTTTVLVVKDPSSNSSKIQKARDYGIEIMSIDQFMGHIS